MKFTAIEKCFCYEHWTSISTGEVMALIKLFSDEVKLPKIKK